MRAHLSRRSAATLRVSVMIAALTLAVGCAPLTRGHVGAQVQSSYPYSTSVALPHPASKWRWLRRVTVLTVAAIQREVQRRENNDLDHHMRLVDALSIFLPGAPVPR